MCQGLIIKYPNRTVEIINIGQFVEHFGRDLFRWYEDNDDGSPEEYWTSCLCWVDVQPALDAHGLRLLGHDAPGFNGFDMVAVPVDPENLNKSAKSS